MEENYKIIDSGVSTSKDGKNYYYVVIYISRGSFVSDTKKVYMSEKAYNYLMSNYKTLSEIDVKQVFCLQYFSKSKTFDLVFDNTLLK